MNYLYLKASGNGFKQVSQKTKLMFRFVAVVAVLLALGIQLQFVIVPALGIYRFWLVVGAFMLLLVANH